MKRYYHIYLDEETYKKVQEIKKLSFDINAPIKIDVADSKVIAWIIDIFYSEVKENGKKGRN